MATYRQRPNLDTFKGIFRLPGQKKMKADTKLTFVMGCQLFDRKSVAQSIGDNRRRGSPGDKIRNFEEKLFE